MNIDLNYLKNVILKWDEELLPFIAKGNAIYLALFTLEGKLVYANQAMSFLYNSDPEGSFVNPTYNFILSADGDGTFFEGIMTFGEVQSINNFSVFGKIIKKNNEILIIGELNIQEIIAHNKLILELNSENNNLNRLLIKEKKALQLTQKELTDINATKDKFFSIIAHDLINPLGNFKIMTQLMYESYNDFTEAERLKFLLAMKDTSNNVFSLLENLLMWSRSQRGKIEFKPESINLYVIVENIFELLKNSADNKKINLVNLVPQSINIIADINFISTIFRNLVSNAIKFTSDGGTIEVGVVVYPSEGFEHSEGYIEIFVRDNGIGISEDTVNKLFRIDQNVTSPGTNREKGTGLGLILCNEFVEKMGGKIWVKSQEGIGSTFYFTVAKKMIEI
jgi:signal transduction histidine kinase